MVVVVVRYEIVEIALPEDILHVHCGRMNIVDDMVRQRPSDRHLLCETYTRLLKNSLPLLHGHLLFHHVPHHCRLLFLMCPLLRPILFR